MLGFANWCTCLTSAMKARWSATSRNSSRNTSRRKVRRAGRRQRLSVLERSPVRLRGHHPALAVVLFAILGQSCGSSQSSTPDKPGAMVVGALDALTRVGFAEPIAVSSSVHLYAARGEYESF